MPLKTTEISGWFHIHCKPHSTGFIWRLELCQTLATTGTNDRLVKLWNVSFLHSGKAAEKGN